MNCLDLQYSHSIYPSNTGLNITPFELYSTVSSIDSDWLEYDKIIISDVYTGDETTGSLISSITSYDFFNDKKILTFSDNNYLTAIHTVSTSEQLCTIIYTDSALRLQSPGISSYITGTNIDASLSSSNVYSIDVPGSVTINIENIYSGSDILGTSVARIQLPTGEITSCYAPITLIHPVTSYEALTWRISSIPLVSSEDLSTDNYLNQAILLGVNYDDIYPDVYKIINTAFSVSSQQFIKFKYIGDYTTQALTGYSPLLSIYPNNTGTVFEILPSITFNKYTSEPVLTSFNLSYDTLATQLSDLKPYNTLTAFNINSQYNELNTPLNIPLIIIGNISGAEPPYTELAYAKNNIVIVDPPVPTLTIDCTQTVMQDGVQIVNHIISANISMDCELPCVYVLDTGIPERDLIIGYLSETVQIIVPPIPGSTHTAILSVFPLLSGTTDIDYITGDSRTIETGINPIILTKQYMYYNHGGEIQHLDNIHLDLNTSSITYNNNTVSSTDAINISSANAFIYTNQFNQTTAPTLKFKSYIADGETTTIADLLTSLTEHNIYLNIIFNGITSDSVIFNLHSLENNCYLETLAPIITTDIILTARVKDSLAISYKVIPYTPITFNYIIPCIYFSQFTPSWHASVVNPVPFEVTVWSDNTNTVDSIYTYVDGSKSQPYDENLTRYSRLVPQWWFQDIDGNKKEIYELDNTKIYNEYDGLYIGTSGTCQFYFNDDTPTGSNGEILVVSPIVSGFVVESDMTDNVVEYPGYSNPLVRATHIYYVNSLYQDKLDITRDGIRPLKNYYWYTNSIPNTITIGSYRIPYSIDFTYPYNNNLHPFTIGISGEQGIDQVLSPNVSGDNFTVKYFNTSFNAIDDYGNISTGYVRTSVSPTLSTGMFNLLATVSILPTGGYVHTPYMWVCDNKSNSVVRLYYDDITYAQNNECMQNSITQQCYNVPVTGVLNMHDRNGITDVMSITGISDVTNVAIGDNFEAWFTDAGNDLGLKVNTYGIIDNIIRFPTGSTPGGVCIDVDNNVWFTLVDDISALKYDSNGEFITCIVSPCANNEYEDNIYKPGYIEADINNNVWVTFYNSLCSMVNKYTPTGELIESYTLPEHYAPTDIIIDGNIPYSVWILSEFCDNQNDELGSVDSFNRGAIHKIYNNTLETVLSGFNTPIHSNIDIYGNIWINIGDGNLLAYNINTQLYATYNLNGIISGTYNNVKAIAGSSDNIFIDSVNGLVSDVKIDGIGCFSDGTLRVISSINNKVYILNISDDQSLSIQTSFNIYPHITFNSPYNDIYNVSKWEEYNTIINPYFYEVVNSDWDIGIQAYGDWTGLRRIIKYNPTHSTAYTISGTSNVFEIKTSPPEIRTINDSYDLPKVLSKMFPDVMGSDTMPILHSELLPGALGTPASKYQTIGREFFEKISNFVMNHSDVDFCNVNQLYNLAKQLDVNIDDYNLSYPSDIIRAMDILSIQHKRLFGDIDSFNRRFISRRVATSDDSTETIKSKLNMYDEPLSSTTQLTAGQSLVVHDLVHNKYDVLYINTDTQLKYLSGYGLNRPVYNFDVDSFNQYKFYTHKTINTPKLINSYIDWNNTYTTVVSSVSSIDEWYKDEGIVDQIFNYYLNEGLGFINT